MVVILDNRNMSYCVTNTSVLNLYVIFRRIISTLLRNTQREGLSHTPSQKREIKLSTTQTSAKVNCKLLS